MCIIRTEPTAKHLKTYGHRPRFTAVRVVLSVTSLIVSLFPTAIVKAQCDALSAIMSAYSRARQASGPRRQSKGTRRQRKVTKPQPEPVVDAPDVAILRGHAQKWDEFGNIRGCDMKARLDNFAIQLQNEPSSTGYIATYSVPVNGRNFGEDLAERAKDYLVNTRGIEASRIATVNGGQRNELTTQLWIARPTSPE